MSTVSSKQNDFFSYGLTWGRVCLDQPQTSQVVEYAAQPEHPYLLQAEASPAGSVPSGLSHRLVLPSESVTPCYPGRGVQTPLPCIDFVYPGLDA